MTSDQQPWWELSPLDANSELTIKGRIEQTGQGSQNAIGEGIYQSIVNASPIPDADDVATVRSKITEIKASIQNLDIPTKNKGLVEYQLEQIERQLTRDTKPINLEILKSATEWIIRNVPNGIKLMKELFTLSAVARLLTAEGEVVINWLKAVFTVQ